jgi:hypothetical protein
MVLRFSEGLTINCAPANMHARAVSGPSRFRRLLKFGSQVFDNSTNDFNRPRDCHITSSTATPRPRSHCRDRFLGTASPHTGTSPMS